jgi:outer membrane lipoprotein-sorting protein
MRPPIFILGFCLNNPYQTRLRRFAGHLTCFALVMAAVFCLGWADSWESIRAAAGNVDSISADFIQEKHLPILARPLVSTGRLLYRRPDALRWEYSAPVKSVLLMQNGDVRRFVNSEKGLIEDASVRLQAMQFVMPEISGWLGGRFQDNPMFEAGLYEGRRILLVPKDAAMARFVQRIELLLSDRPGVIEQVMIFESEDAFTRMIFSNTQVNPALDHHLFQEAQ